MSAWSRFMSFLARHTKEEQEEQEARQHRIDRVLDERLLIRERKRAVLDEYGRIERLLAERASRRY
jgi:hypothetical protein